uniref:protein fuzzy homolog n=1 Tax=Oncorhynchus gorbuscha TaxID=8017 RepID=UPI001EAF69A0|nr:protein fuzzy homolog [Oncorhynchus gorbuscha]
MMLQQAGSVQLLCLTANSGVPLFTRGASKQLPFSIIGSLNGVHMFGAGQGVVLAGCETDRGGRMVWRVFQDSVMLIAVSSGRQAQQEGGGAGEEDLHLRRLLENVWNCMVLVLGQDELASLRNVERLKRDLRSCYRLIDQLMEGGQGQEGIMGDLTHCADCLLPPNATVLQEGLDCFTQAADSEFGCLMVHGRIATATEKWWRLAPQEVVLLSVLTRSLSLSGSASCDTPVFLPQGSPTVAHRLLRFQLLPGVDVCVLCGPSPTLHRAESELVGCFWSPLLEALRGSLAVGERCLPGSVTLRPDVLALLLINRESRRSVSCVKAIITNPNHPPSDHPLPSKARCWELLRLFYTFTTTRYFPLEETPALTPGEKAQRGDSLREDFALGFSHQPLQCYLVTEECKCFGLQTAQHQLYLLTPLSVPTFALSSVATQTLSAITLATGF